jgi:hypothetical protein
MPAEMKMLGCMLARRVVATAYMPTFAAAPQVQPPSATRQALDAAISAWFYSWIDPPNASVLFLHCASPTRVLSTVILSVASQAGISYSLTPPALEFFLAAAMAGLCGSKPISKFLSLPHIALLALWAQPHRNVGS